ncbi:hypothetical protein F4781DRAFT_431458 [Annulohypoxylon bovei var. microspora]|nr:hypothetical protein F4781DRAFT_431458 [Annulohypoxylon bovei var. microspora]
MASKLLPFRSGTKQIFLPKFAIALLRKGGQRPNFATFKVPLRFNKFDLRDFLLHAYNVAVLNVRSQLKSRPTKRKKNGHMIRPLPAKIMTVELRQPFVWPARPKDITPWKSPQEQRRTRQLKNQSRVQKLIQKKNMISMRDERKPDKSKMAIRKHAERLLKSGSWKNDWELDPKFSNPKYSQAKKSY